MESFGTRLLMDVMDIHGQLEYFNCGTALILFKQHFNNPIGCASFGSYFIHHTLLGDQPCSQALLCFSLGQNGMRLEMDVVDNDLL